MQISKKHYKILEYITTNCNIIRQDFDQFEIFMVHSSYNQSRFQPVLNIDGGIRNIKFVLIILLQIQLINGISLHCQ